MNPIKVIAISIFFLLFASLHAIALSGKYTINASGSGPRNFKSFNAAIKVLKDSGVSGPVLFNISNGKYHEQILIGAINGASAVNTISFQSASGDSSKVVLDYNKTSGTNNYTVFINNSSYVSFNRITITRSDSINSKFGRVIEISGGYHIEFNNCLIIGIKSITNGTEVIFSGANSLQDSFITFSGNLIRYGYYGVEWYGKDSFSPDVSVYFINNYIDSSTIASMNISYQNNLIIQGNKILGNKNLLTNEVSLFFLLGHNRISGNNIHSLQNGLFFTKCNSMADSIFIVNNMIICKKGYPFFADGSFGMFIYYNSFHCTGKFKYSSASYIVNTASYAANTYFINNICQNDSGGLASYSFQGITYANNNNLFTNGTYVAQWNYKLYKSLAALQFAELTELQSVSVKADFISNNNLHLIKKSKNNIHLKKGTPLKEVVSDYDGNSRDTAYPCIGADETKLSYSMPYLTGKIYNDENVNRKMDSNEKVLKNYPVAILEDSVKVFEYLFTDENGKYFTYANFNKFRVKPIMKYELLKVLPKDTDLVIIDSTKNFSNIDFGVYEDTMYNDMNIYLYGRGTLRVGINRFELNIANHGKVIDSPIVLLNGLLNIKKIDSIVSPYSLGDITSSGIRYNDTSISIIPGKYYAYKGDNFFIYYTLKDSIKLGEKIILSTAIMNKTKDINISNNYDTAIRIVRESYDPNMKFTADTARSVKDSKPIDYMVNFQNTGNDYAYNVVVKDKLDDNLNPETFNMLSYSHKCTYKIVNRELIVTYPNINLPDSTNDEPNSHGYFCYNISPYKNLANGTDIKNTAYIYFDSNPAVVTNTVSTFFGTVGIEESFSSNNNNLLIYPNPTSSVTTLEVINLRPTNTTIIITDVLNRKILQLNQTPDAEGKLVKEVDVSALPKGMYFVSVQNGNMRTVSKLVIR